MSSPTAFHVLAKPAGAKCNLECAYCFFLSKDLLYPGSRFRMADDLLETYIRQLIESHSRSAEVTVAWQGGEPTLMGLEFFRQAVALAQQYRRPGQHVAHTIQTNAIVVDDEWASFFKQNSFLVGVSLDGPRDMHDVYRVDKGGKGSFDRVMRGLKCLREHDVDVNILCGVHAGNQDFPLEVYRFFRDELDMHFLQFIPIVERALYIQDGSPVTPRSVNPERYGRFLNAIFDEWVRDDVGTVFVQHFDSALANWLQVRGAVCVFTETCGESLALEHNGDVYSCDHFVEPAYKVGNIRETRLIQLLASDHQQAFGAAKRADLPRYCQECPVRFACHGECPRNRFLTTPDGAPGLNYLCAGYRMFFTHIDRPMRLMANLLRQGRYADEVMDLLSRDVPSSPEHFSCPSHPNGIAPGGMPGPSSALAMREHKGPGPTSPASR